MPGPSDRERLLRLIDSAGTPSTPVSEQAAAEATAPLARPQAVFQFKERAAFVYDRVRAAVVSSENDQRFPMGTALVILLAAAVFLFGVDRWRMWNSTREVAVADDAQTQQIQQSLGIKLVGVDWSEVPVALVEDQETGKTHFVRQGDSVKGARVQLIFKDKVIFQTPKGRIALR